MTQDSNNRDDLPHDAIPARLREALARLDGPPIEIPSALDKQILGEARAGFRRRVRFRPIVRWAAAVTAVAAILAIASGI